jgi:hypothetical protein
MNTLIANGVPASEASTAADSYLQNLFGPTDGGGINEAMKDPSSFQPGGALKDYPSSFDTNIDGKPVTLPQGTVPPDGDDRWRTPGPHTFGDVDAYAKPKDTAANSPNGTNGAENAPQPGTAPPPGSDAAKPGYNEAIDKMRADDAAFAAKVNAENNGTQGIANNGAGLPLDPRNAPPGSDVAKPGYSETIEKMRADDAALAAKVNAELGGMQIGGFRIPAPGEATGGTASNAAGMNQSAITINPGGSVTYAAPVPGSLAASANSFTGSYTVTSANGKIGGAINTNGDVTLNLGSGKASDGFGGYVPARNEISGSLTINPNTSTVSGSANVQFGDKSFGLSGSNGPGTQTWGANYGGWEVSRTTSGNTDSLTGGYTAGAKLPFGSSINSTTAGTLSFESHPKGGTYNGLINTEEMGFKSVQITGSETVSIKTPVAEAQHTFEIFGVKFDKGFYSMGGGSYDNGKILFEDDIQFLTPRDLRPKIETRLNWLQSYSTDLNKQGNKGQLLKVNEEITDLQRQLNMLK